MKGSEIDIVNLIQNSLPKLNPQPVKILYNASKGDLTFLEIIIEKLGLLANKDIIIEFLSLLTGQSTKANALADKIGVYEEDHETFEALLSFIVTTTKYFLQVKPKILSQIEGVKQFIKENEIDFREFIDPIRHSLESCIIKLIISGAIDIRKTYVIVGNIASNNLIDMNINKITGSKPKNRDLQKNIISLLSKDKILAFLDNIINNVSVKIIKISW